MKWNFDPNIESELPSGSPPYIQNEAPDDIKTDYEMYGTANLDILSGTAIPEASDITNAKKG